VDFCLYLFDTVRREGRYWGFAVGAGDRGKGAVMAESVLEAIKLGERDFEPLEPRKGQFPATLALPGSDEKLAVLAERAARGLPLWHGSDRLDWENLSQSERTR